MEYKRLSEVDMGTADDSTNVIAEVNGEIKRVPKSEVGGAGGYIMTLTADNFDPSTKVCTEKYDEMYDVLMAGGSVWIDISYVLHSDTPSRCMCMTYFVDAEGLTIIIFADNFLPINFPNGSHNPESSSGGAVNSVE